MISANFRPTEAQSQSAVKTASHLTLLEWDDAAQGAKTLGTVRLPGAPLGNPVRKDALDRWYNGGVLALLAVTIAAMVETLAQF